MRHLVIGATTAAADKFVKRHAKKFEGDVVDTCGNDSGVWRGKLYDQLHLLPYVNFNTRVSAYVCVSPSKCNPKTIYYNTPGREQQILVDKTTIGLFNVDLE